MHLIKEIELINFHEDQYTRLTVISFIQSVL